MLESNLHWIDYVLIVITILMSSAVGLYYGAVKKKDNSVEEYFLASRNLSTFKIACSQFSTVVSSGSLVGVVAEIFYYGSQSMLGNPMTILARYITMKIFFPVYFNVGSHDIYKYYEITFNKPIRNILSLMAITEQILMSGVVIYGTSSALTKATGINVWIVIFTLTTICAVYSALGGVRGVALADTVQSFVIIGAVIVLFVLGIIRIGGFAEVWNRNEQGGRIEFFNFNLNPMTRHTVWTAMIGSLINFTASFSTSQTVLMRAMTTSSLQRSVRATLLGQLLISGNYIMCAMLGLIIYAFYYACDPIASGIISSPNQLTASFVDDIFMGYYGLSGLFYSALICAAISTLSSNLNSMSAMLMESFVRPIVPKLVATDRSYTRVAKTSTFIVAALAMASTMTVQRFPNVHQAGMVLTAASNGPNFALLFIGILFPRANIKSSVGSFGIGLSSMLWIVVGSLLINSPSVTKPVSTVGCDPLSNSSMGFEWQSWALNSTVSSPNMTQFPDPGMFNGTIMTQLPDTGMFNRTIETSSSSKWNIYFPLSMASHNWYSTTGVVISLLSFMVLSFIFGGDKDRKVDLKLIPSPVQKLQRKFSRKWQKFLLCDVYENEAFNEMTVVQSEKLIEKQPK